MEKIGTATIFFDILKEDKQLIEEIRENPLTGRPCGDDAFIHKIDGIAGRRLKALPWGRWGRPRKDKK